MAQPETVKKQKKGEKEPSLKGAFVSVLIVGLFIIITWFGVFILFNYRF
ncbi:cytochrome c oxidase subunit IIa family protein [Cytobacillus horneckiae]|nr:cytochrome c oxidase subunit 2A [Cytobacillus horneckiae]MBN6888481.1 cytochrome c oxidase subunit 2A [Cytobacillus horneckiae]